MTCQGEGKVRRYWGESHRSGWDRSRDHADALRSRDETYAVVKHWVKDHPEGQPSYKFEVMRSFKSSLERQVMESIQIDEEDPEVRLNSKSEWGSNKIPRLMIDPDSQYSPGEQDKPPADQNRGQDQDSHGEVKENGKRGHSSQNQVTETQKVKLPQKQVREENREVKDCNLEQSEKRLKLNILDHFGISRQ